MDEWSLQGQIVDVMKSDELSHRGNAIRGLHWVQSQILQKIKGIV